MEKGFLVFSPDTKEKHLSKTELDGLINFLKSQNIHFIEAEGCYFNSLERSLLVDWTHESFDLVIGLAKFYKQESVLLVDSDKRAYLRFLDNRGEVEVGNWTQVHIDIAANSECYTRVNDSFYITT